MSLNFFPQRRKNKKIFLPHLSLSPLIYSLLFHLLDSLQEMMEHDRYQREIEDLKAACHKAEREVEEEIEAFR